MTVANVQQETIYTYADYAEWPDEERWELIDGIPCAQAAPNTDHQRIVGRLFRQIANHFDGKDCEPFPAPFSVVLPERNQERKDAKTVVEPDIVVICDKTKIHKFGCEGAPDLIVEILSPSTSSRDTIKKRLLYERHGVREYWIVDPVHRLVTAHRLVGDKFGPAEYYSHEHMAIPAIFTDLEINLAEVFAGIGEEEPEGLRENID